MLVLSAWFCTIGVLDIHGQFFPAGLTETSPLQERNTSIFDPTLLFAAFMYVKLLFYYLSEHI